MSFELCNRLLLDVQEFLLSGSQMLSDCYCPLIFPLEHNIFSVLFHHKIKEPAQILIITGPKIGPVDLKA